ncbi:MAG: L-histidine N(alpha)-methyltransferase, partial [Acidobacteria bacterium]|nr:L-histidine N(alpha)-methyltransferase [Acidobacteriota bacterium]
MPATQLEPVARLDFARDVRAALSKPGQKELPSLYLYDEVGTALFEAITWLP